MISTEQVKALREQTGISVMQCKKALEDAEGDMGKALLFLKKKGAEIASKKSDRALGAGVVASYIHSDSKIGVLVEVLSETDFVSKNEEFRRFADDIAMHIAAMSPLFLKDEDIGEEARKRAIEEAREEVKTLDKPHDIKEKIIEGKVASFFAERTLLSQPFVKEPNLTVRDLLFQIIQKTGEKVEISRFVRFSLLKD